MSMKLRTQDQVPMWIQGWLLLSSIVVTWVRKLTKGYTPYSMEGGSLNFIWKPYNLYGTIDHFYGHHALAIKDGFTGAQATMNVIETFLNILYLYLLRQENITVGQCNLVGFSGALMTLSKTILYWLIEPFSGYQHIGHNSIKNLVFLWIIPNGLWIVVPGMIAYFLGKDIISRLGSHPKQL
ncbi:hypothetical protein HPULCUR_000094 [Helicostylum pulchrum]|uniref:Uncharacterized protein n=1 Tax=Helicostylum pulchrum TaxID=562976 RepID=A0ABP9XJX0_9FUNG